MKVLGIVGGVASGKSFVAEQFAKLGAHRINADRVGHEVLQETEIKEQLRSRWGEDLFHPDGEVDRSAVAKMVFAETPHGRRERAFLEQVTHPRISARMQQTVASLEGDVRVVVLDAALLMEAGWDQFCDIIVFVEASRPLRLARARQRGWNEAEFDAREAAQLNLEDKRRRATHTIDNNGPGVETIRHIQVLWNQLLSTDPSAHLT